MTLRYTLAVREVYIASGSTDDSTSGNKAIVRATVEQAINFLGALVSCL